MSEHDIIKGLANQGAEFLATPVDQVMKIEVAVCTQDDDARDVIRKMQEHGYRHMPVVEDGKPVGIVSSRDVLRYQVDKLSTND